jgi:hypothetical protein
MFFCQPPSGRPVGPNFSFHMAKLKFKDKCDCAWLEMHFFGFLKQGLF